MYECEISIIYQAMRENIAHHLAESDVLLPPLVNIIVEYAIVSNLDTFLRKRHYMFRRFVDKKARLYLRVSNEYYCSIAGCYKCNMARLHLDFQIGIETSLPDMDANIVTAIPIGEVFRFIAGDPTIRLELPKDNSVQSRAFIQMREFIGVSNAEIQMGLDSLLSQWRESVHWQCD